MKTKTLPHGYRSVLYWFFFSALLWVALLLPFCGHGQIISIGPATIVDPAAHEPDTTREFTISGDTLFVVETWAGGYVLVIQDFPDIYTKVYRPAGRRRLIYRLTLLKEQKPCMIEHTETIIQKHLEEQWSDQKK